MHYYQYLHDPEFVIESEEPRDDLLEWAYWSEITADEAAKAKPAKPADEPKPAAKKAAPRTAAKAEGA